MQTVLKSAGVILENSRILVTRDKGEDIFFAPGGRIDPGETPEQTVIRELNEELSIIVNEKDLQDIGTYTHPMGTDQSKLLEMHVFLIQKYQGTIQTQNEIEEIKWIDSKEAQEIKLGSIFKEEVIPRLKDLELIY